MHGAGGSAINGAVLTVTVTFAPFELRLALRNPIARIAQPTRLWIPRLPVPVPTRALRWLFGSNFLGVPVLNRNPLSHRRWTGCHRPTRDEETRHSRGGAGWRETKKMGSTGAKTGGDSNHLIKFIRLWRVGAGGERAILVSSCLSTVEDVRSVGLGRLGIGILDPR